MKKIFTLFFLICVTYTSQAQEAYSFSLDEAIQYALKNNYTVRNASLDIDAAEKQKWEATSFGLPQVDAGIDYQNWIKQQVSFIPSEIIGGEPGEFTPVVFGTKQNMNATVTVNQLIFDGSYLVGLQSAKTFLMISNLAKEKTDQTIREAVINAYGNVLVAQETLAILYKNKEVLEKNLNETRILLQNGFTEEQDFEQQQITLLNIENEINRSSRLETISKQALNITMGIPIETEVELTENLENLAIKSTDMQMLSQEFDLENHVDFRIADNQVLSDELLVKYEKSKSIPSINAFVNYSTFQYGDEIAFQDFDENWFDSSLFGISMKIPVFSSLQRSSRTQQAKINLMQSEIEKYEISENLKLQVSTAKNKYQFSLDQFQTSKKNLALAERIAEKEQIKFFEGLSSSIDLTNTQNQLFGSQQDYIQSILEIIQSKVELENALNLF
ncbi:TolC family protein [Lutimonas zeaxanthinifaciens]|uniref:TolC family protein n=1 Tax=Lutimonas zeaxanthinifaciens TaxID=3060215 RepID=UPI00265D25F7|nr:TolC family protein [Lutimonas sp. YSD2104]WKK65790.1 TolC family protein [Lutimonas sp. YSD2104]